MHNVKLTRLLAKAANNTVLVVGDACLDENVYGKADGIAKEAPVLALEAERRVLAPGQATNVAANAAALGARVRYFGIVGCDEAGTLLRGLLEAAGIDAVGLEMDPGRRTTHKIKYLGRECQRHGQHLFHAYFQDTHKLAGDVMKRMGARIREGLGVARALIFSDYGNGVLAPELIGSTLLEARARDVVTIVNARGDLRKYRGAAVVVANVEELAALVGAGAGDDPASALAAGAAHLRCRHLVITAGSGGMYFGPLMRGKVGHLAPRARMVADVTGAGDTVTAALAVALGAGATLEDAAAFANLAAACAVATEGTAAPTAAELRARAHAKAGL